MKLYLGLDSAAKVSVEVNTSKSKEFWVTVEAILECERPQGGASHHRDNFLRKPP